MPNLLVSATTRYDPKGLNKAQKHISAFDKTVKNLGKTFAGVFAARKVLQFGKASVQAFVADDKAARSLSNTLKNVGAQYAATNVEDYIEKLQRQTGVLDDNLRPAFQSLLIATGDVAKSQEALNLALDISANGVISLETATKALAKGFAGNTTTLGKMGGAVSKATLATGDMNKITAELTAKYKGSALTAIGGYAGQMAKLTVASENAKETIGKGLLNSLSLLGGKTGIGTVTDAINELSIGLSEAIVSTGKLVAELKKMPVVGGYLNKIISNPLNLPSNLRAFGKGGLLDSYREMGRSKVKTGYGQQSPGERNAAVAYNKKLATQKREELATLAAKNKATREEAQMKKDQAALDALKAKFDLERIGLNVALNQATDEETKARIRAQIAILDETGKTAQAANDALVKAQADKLKQEVEATTALNNLAKSAAGAAGSLTNLSSYFASFKGSAASAVTNLGTTAQAALGGYVPFVGATNASLGITGNGMRVTDSFPSTVGLGLNGTGNQLPAGVTINVNTGPSMADENTIVDAVQDALNEIARRGYLTTYAGALPA